VYIYISQTHGNFTSTPMRFFASFLGGCYWLILVLCFLSNVSILTWTTYWWDWERTLFLRTGRLGHLFSAIPGTTSRIRLIDSLNESPWSHKHANTFMFLFELAGRILSRSQYSTKMLQGSNQKSIWDGYLTCWSTINLPDRLVW